MLGQQVQPIEQLPRVFAKRLVELPDGYALVHVILKFRGANYLSFLIPEGGGLKLAVRR